MIPLIESVAGLAFLTLGSPGVRRSIKTFFAPAGRHRGTSAKAPDGL